MSYEIYLCHKCWWPVWFPFGMKMHLGTGWYCWKKQQRNEGSFEDAIAEGLIQEMTVSVMKPYNREQLFERAKQLFEVSIKQKEFKNLLSFLKKQLKMERGDVIKDFLRFIAKQNESSVTSLLKKLTMTPEWLLHSARILKTDKPENITT